MREAVIVSTARTPIGKAYRGAFNNTEAATLGGHVVRHAVQRAGLEPAEIEDVVMGCALPQGTQGHNIARQTALAGGLPVTTAGMTVGPSPWLRKPSWSITSTSWSVADWNRSAWFRTNT
jgi:acetyl-CoA C-acetyltransferase